MKPGYKQTEVGVIPENWDSAIIGDVATFSGGSQPPRSTFKFSPTKGYVRLIQIRDYKTDEYASFIPETMARKRCTAEDIMIGRYGPPVFQILRGIEGAYNVALIKASPNQRISREFFFYVLGQEKLFQLIDSLSRRSSGQTGVEMPALKAYELPLPPLPEQRAIATALSDVDALLGALDRLIAKKRDLKQAAMQQLLTGQTRLPGFHGEWEWKTLGEILSRLANGAVYKASNSSGLPITRIETIANGTIDYSRTGTVEVTAELESYKMLSGDILFSHINSLDHIGKVAQFQGERELYHGMNLLLLRTGKLADSRFIYFWFTSAPARKIARNMARQAVSQASINTTELKKLEIFLPPLPEQTAIAAVLTDMDAELALLTQRLSKTRALKQGMMQELLTGRTRLV